MGDKMKKIIRSEREFSKWFEKNFKKLGYTKIIRPDQGKFPDYIMLKKGKEVKVELETLSSNFILHKHDINKVDEVICITKDIELKIPIKEVKSLKFKSKTVRVSATIEPKNKNFVEMMVKTGKYRNKSHLIEEAINLLWEREFKK